VDRDKVAKALNKASPGVRLGFNEPMSSLTSLRIGGPADVVIAPLSVDDAVAVIKALGKLDLGFLPIGGGTNLLVMDAGIREAVLHMSSIDDMSMVGEAGSEVTLAVGAGLPMNRLLGFIRREGLSGMEGLSGIPGYVGGAIAGNAGSYGSEMMDVVNEVILIRPDGMTETLGKGQFSFGYRSSGLPEDSVIVGAKLVLSRDESVSVAARMDEALRKKNATQPLGQRSAGCVFKNPPGDSAARRIDEAGCKGMSVGSIMVSEKHAGFFINRGGGTASDFMRLMESVSKRVRDAFDIDLEPEIKVVGSET